MIEWVIFSFGLIFISVGLYIAIMGPSRFHRHGYVGAIHRWFRTQLPLCAGETVCMLRYCCRRQKAKAAWLRWRLEHRHGFQRNWFFVIVYVLLVWTIEVLYLFFCLPHLKARFLSKLVSYALVIVSEVLYGLAVFSDPGVVSSYETVQKQLAVFPLSNGSGGGGDGTAAATATATTRIGVEYILNRRYPVDGILYERFSADDVAADASLSKKQKKQQQPLVPPATWETDFRNHRGVPVMLGQVCRTCALPKPARSKHCSACQHCVRRFDHHCPWINNDVAEGTLRYFCGFLFVHAISSLWGVLDLYLLIKQFLVRHQLWGWQMRRGKRVYELGVLEYATILTTYQLLPVMLCIMALSLCIVLFCFWGYVMSFVYRNITMNDMRKIDEVMYFIDQLETLDDVYKELRVMGSILAIVSPQNSALPALFAISPPPPELCDIPCGNTEGYDELSAQLPKKKKSTTKKVNPPSKEVLKQCRSYRGKAVRALKRALERIYDHGIYQNVKEAFVPGCCVTPDLLTDVVNGVREAVAKRAGAKHNAVQLYGVDIREKNA